jgi:hypothetical protein
MSKKNNLIVKKISKGLQLSFKKLVREAALRNDELVFEENGKIKFVKAKKIKV